MRDQYEEVQGLGAELVMIGTGDVRYAQRFVRDQELPFPVLADDDAEATW